MNCYTAVKTRLLWLMDEKNMSMYKPAMCLGASPSTVESILYGKSRNPRIVTLKMLCDVMDVTLSGFFDAPIFADLEQEIK